MENKEYQCLIEKEAIGDGDRVIINLLQSVELFCAYVTREELNCILHVNPLY